MDSARETYEDSDLEHLRFLLSDDELHAYLDATPQERLAGSRVFWARLDPTPTTPENERKTEHYRRLAYALDRFGVVPEPRWDRRGELLLRYGPPDQRIEEFGEVLENVGLVPPRETWVYWTRERAFVLEDPTFSRDFVYAFDLDPDREKLQMRDWSKTRLSELEAWSGGPIPGHSRPASTDDAESELARRRLQSMLALGQEALLDAPQDYIHDHGGGALDYVFDVHHFAGDLPGKTRVEVNFAYWASELDYRPSGEAFESVREIEATAKTPDYETVSALRTIARDERSTLDGREGQLVMDRVAFELDPAAYRLALSVRDSVSRNVGIYTTEANLLDFGGSDIAMSDLQLAAEVRSAREGDSFRKGELQVVPYPLSTFPLGRDVFFYFEVYHLAASADGRSVYDVEILLEPHVKPAGTWFGDSSKGRLVPGVATAYGGTSASSTIQEYLSLDATSLTVNVYDVTITVTDRISERNARRTVTFRVQRP